MTGDLRERLAQLSPQQRAALEQQVLGGPAQPAAPWPARMPDDVEPRLSPGQERLWFLQRFDPDDASYNLHLTERLRGPLDVGVLQRAADTVLERHEVLRTRVDVVDGQPVPVVELDARAVVDELPAADEAHALRIVSELVNRPFQLAQAPLVRLTVLRLGQDDHVLSLVLHHIAGDGWSLDVFARELSQAYAAFDAGKSPQLPPLHLRYADFAYGRRSQPEPDVPDDLAPLPPLDVPTDRPRPPVRSSRGGHVRRRLDGRLADGIAELAAAERASVFMVLLAGFQTVLSRMARQPRFGVGTPLAGRDRAELQQLIGQFTTTLVLPAEVRADDTFRRLLRRVRDTALRAYDQPDISLERLLERQTDGDRDPSRTPLFQTMVNLQPAKTGLLALPGVRAEPCTPDFAHVKVDLELDINQYPDHFELDLGYSTALFDEATAQGIAGCLEQLLGAAVADPERPVDRLPLLTGEQRSALVLNDTAADYPQRRLHELFAEQAVRTPDSPAVIAGERVVTYAELRQRADAIAGRLRAAGVGQGEPVAVLLPRDVDLVAALLGVLTAGCPYVPLEPRHPVQRQRRIVTGSGAVALLAGSDTGLGLHPCTIALDGVPDGAQEPQPPPETPGTPDELAYLIYTSGSTGEPKGVRVPHRGVVNLVTDAARRHRLTAHDRFLALTSLSFDIAALEIFAPLLTGGAVVMASDSSVHAADEVGELVGRAGVTLVQAPPSVLEALLPRLPRDVERIISGGEPLSAELAQRLLEHAGDVWNYYGPTETTIWSTCWQVRPGQPVSLGRPVANTRMYVLDERLEPVPPGWVGELFLAGDGLARDYVGEPALTAQRFLPCPHGPGRMYRTGDLVRWRGEDHLEFVGRGDDQVKLGGVRIEPGEVEAALAAHPQVRKAAVTVRSDTPAGRAIVAYVAWDGSGDPADVLPAYLRESLPEAMIPAAIVPLADFPVLPSGKLDRAALPAPGRRARDAVEPPATDAEELVAAVFADALGLAGAGAADDFFALGGTSLLAVKVTTELAATTQVEVPLRLLFVNRTVRALAAAVEELLVAELDRLSEDDAALLAGTDQEV